MSASSRFTDDGDTFISDEMDRLQDAGQTRTIRPLRRGVQQTSLASAIRHGAEMGGSRSVCVLDTNTLLSANTFFTALFELVFQMAKQSIDHSTSPPPFVIVIPHAVLQELDGLKTGGHRGRSRNSESVAHKARQAGNDLLRAVQRLGKPALASGAKLPPHRRPLIVQTREQAHEMALEQGNATVDETIVHICLTLQRQTSLPVLFCSNDNNARTRAEIEGVRTFDLDTVLRSTSRPTIAEIRNNRGPNRSSSSSIWTPDSRDTQPQAAKMLLEQWNTQLEEQQHELESFAVQDVQDSIASLHQQRDEGMDLDEQSFPSSSTELESSVASSITANKSLPQPPIHLNPHISLPTSSTLNVEAASPSSKRRKSGLGSSLQDSIHSAGAGRTAMLEAPTSRYYSSGSVPPQHTRLTTTTTANRSTASRPYGPPTTRATSSRNTMPSARVGTAATAATGTARSTADSYWASSPKSQSRNGSSSQRW